ncbi:hypothetical protein DAPPUDRAFT_237275 [Daphnia pulex]|uniref:Uncharacterized protein n=1 Tax=Daphnia pulex TaxID=6669 RepID=E9G3I7_DAPPU|nr:hypothetical protein DAPPUDRAFT_237275 [Daphnia pulex]|eukprot:EFX85780.1 hypothetical protein DAPPUDRAFT_237275 [Daphnia pulex]
MNFLTMRSSTACLFLLHLSSCYAGPVRSPRTSAVKLHDVLANIQGVARNDQPSQIQDYFIPIEENNRDLSDTTNEPFVDQSAFQDFGVQEPEMVTDALTYFSLPAVYNGGTEQPALPLDAKVIHSDLLNSGSIETEILSDVQEPTQNLEEAHSEIVGEQETVMDHLVVLPMETTELYHLPTVAAPSDPAELPLMYPLVRVPTAPSATSATVADSLLETILPSTTEKVEISSSPEALYHSSVSSGPEQWISVDALPLELDPKAQTTSSSLITDSQIIQVDQPKCHSNISYEPIAADNPNGKESNSSGLPFGSHRCSKLRELRFPTVSNTKENFGVQINWDEFMFCYS